MAQVLVVDDDAIVRLIVSQFLQLGNHTVTEADSGEEAIRSLNHDKPDLVVTDLSMPGMSGRQLRARSRRLWPEIPFIIMSGHLIGDDLPSEFDGVLEKPLTSADVLNAVDEVLSRRQTFA
jgi:CheY-like chemotaxis protein